MDLFFPYIIGFLCISLSFIFLIIKRKPTCINLPPGKTGWPIVGETMEFIKVARNGQPEKFINDRINKYSPDVFQTSLLREKMAVFCGASGNKLLFSNENKLVASWWPPSIKKVLLFPSPMGKYSSKKESNKMRSFLSEFLKPETLQQYIAIMDSMANQHLDSEWVPYKQVKVFPLSKKYTFALACRLFMSIDDPNHVAKLADPFTLVTSGLVSVPINFPGTAFSQAIKGGKIIRDELMGIIRRRKRELLETGEQVTGDLLTRMVMAKDENGKFTCEMEIASYIIGLLIGGYDTTSTAITFILNYLAELPHIYTEVFKEQMEIAKNKGPEEFLNWHDIQKMKYSWNVATEAMRLAPPAQGAFREAITDFTYAGFTIPKGWKTYWSVHSTHRNPRCFPNPEKFDPSRFEGSGPAPFTFVPFGGGPRMCPGKEYARLEILVFIHNVVTKFKWQKVIPNEEIIYNPSPILVHGLPIHLEPHQK